MRLLVLSDSHRKFTNIDIVFGKLYTQINAVIHLGDEASDMNLYKKLYKEIAFYGVRGNCDFDAYTEAEDMITVFGKKIFFLHGHKFNVKLGYMRLAYAAQEREADICLFGHTHAADLFCQERIVFLNPGSISIPRGGDYPSYGIIEIDEKKTSFSIVALTKSGFQIKSCL